MLLLLLSARMGDLEKDDCREYWPGMAEGSSLDVAMDSCGVLYCLLAAEMGTE